MGVREGGCLWLRVLVVSDTDISKGGGTHLYRFMGWGWLDGVGGREGVRGWLVEQISKGHHLCGLMLGWCGLIWDSGINQFVKGMGIGGYVGFHQHCPCDLE